MATKVMAIINTSPDSFSGDGARDAAEAEQRIRAAIDNGADILDIGGQSTRPGADIISVEEELRRVIPPLSLARRLTALPISVDTFKPEVARHAIEAGATIINDTTGCADPAMVEVLKQFPNVQIVVMHSRGTPQTMSKLIDYPHGVVPELLGFFVQRTAELINSGIAHERIIIDPGIGFAKSPQQSFELTQQLAQFCELGFPVLYGASMKSFLGWALSRDGHTTAPLERRHDATTATAVFAALQGAAIVRAHNVTATKDALRIIEAIRNPQLVQYSA